MLSLFAAISCALFIAVCSRLPLSSAAHPPLPSTAGVRHPRNYCCHSTVSAIYHCRPCSFFLLSLVRGSYPCNIWSAVAAAISCLRQTSSSSLVGHCCNSCHCRHPLSEAEPPCLHRHLSFAGAANSCLQPSSPLLVFLNQPPPVAIGLCLSSLLP
jgi:hypothetical protein